MSVYGEQVEGFSPEADPIDPDGAPRPAKMSAEAYIRQFLESQEVKPGDPICDCGWTGEGVHCTICHVGAPTLDEYLTLEHVGHVAGIGGS